MMGKNSNCRRICLFDMDGTITNTRRTIEPEMIDVLLKLQTHVPIGLITGSDIKSVENQLGHDLHQMFDYVFVENGMVAYQKGQVFAKKIISEQIGEEKLQEVINFVLHYLADLHLPIKRGCFVECRTGMINICPMGRCNSTLEDRRIFCEYDKKHKVREKMVKTLRERFSSSGLKFSIGGQTSFDVYPMGWDKTFCLQYLDQEYKEIYFFGDRTSQDGNDYEIFHDSRTISHTVTSPEHTKQLLQQLFFSQPPNTDS